jgi:hypothetical protein
MSEWSEDHVMDICSLNLNFSLVGKTWLNWRSGGALRWKGEDRQMERSGSGMWKVSTFKVVASYCVG